MAGDEPTRPSDEINFHNLIGDDVWIRETVVPISSSDQGTEKVFADKSFADEDSVDVVDRSGGNQASAAENRIEDDDPDGEALEMGPPDPDGSMDFEYFIEEDDSEDILVEPLGNTGQYESRTIGLSLSKDTYDKLDRLLAEYHSSPIELREFLELLIQRSVDGFGEVCTGKEQVNRHPHQYGSAGDWIQQVLGRRSKKIKRDRR